MNFIKKYCGVIIKNRGVILKYSSDALFAVIFAVAGVLVSVLFFELLNKITAKKKKKATSSYEKKLRKSGVIYRFGSPLFYLLARISSMIISGFLGFVYFQNILLAGVVAFISAVFLSIFAAILSKKDEIECEMDVYRTLCNLKIQLKSGAYIDDVIERTKKACISDRYLEALNQFTEDMNNKALTTAESAEYFAEAFDFPAFKEMSNILVTFSSYGESEQIFNDIDETCSGVIDLNSLRLASQVTGRGEFGVTWIYMAAFAVTLPAFVAKFGDVPAISNFICRVISGITRLFS